MKATVKQVDTYETTVVEVICPLCGEVSTYEYPFDEGYYKTERSEPCKNPEGCEAILEFSYGYKKSTKTKAKK